MRYYGFVTLGLGFLLCWFWLSRSSELGVWSVVAAMFGGSLIGYGVGRLRASRQKGSFEASSPPVQSFRHPAWSPVPPGHCPVCKAKPDEPCDAGLHS